MFDWVVQFNSLQVNQTLLWHVLASSATWCSLTTVVSSFPCLMLAFLYPRLPIILWFLHFFGFCLNQIGNFGATVCIASDLNCFSSKAMSFTPFIRMAVSIFSLFKCVSRNSKLLGISSGSDSKLGVNKHAQTKARYVAALRKKSVSMESYEVKSDRLFKLMIAHISSWHIFLVCSEEEMTSTRARLTKNSLQFCISL